MGMRKHLLLVLPTLLAAMGTAEHSAYASDQVGLPPDLAAASDAVSIKQPAIPLAVAARTPETEAKAGDLLHPIAPEALRRTIFEILAEARGRIGFLPDLAATPGIVSTEVARVGRPAEPLAEATRASEAEFEPDNQRQPTVAEAPRRTRTIFDILAEAHGSTRIQTEEASSPDSVANEPSVEAEPEANRPLEHETKAGKASQPIVAGVPSPTAFELVAEAYGSTRFGRKGTSSVKGVANEPSAEPLVEILQPPESKAKVSNRPQPIAAEATSPTAFELEAEAEVYGSTRFRTKGVASVAHVASAPSTEPLAEASRPPAVEAQVGDDPQPIVAEAPRPTIFDILAEAHGNALFLEKDTSPLDSMAHEPTSEPLAAAPSPVNGATGGAPLHPIAAETLRPTILEVLAEARGRIGFRPGLAAERRIVSAENASIERSAEPLVEATGAPESEIKRDNAPRPSIAEPPRRTIFDILAEAHGNPRFLEKEAALAASVTNRPSATRLPEPAPPPESEPRNHEPATANPRPALVAAAAVDPSALDKLRGGFETPGGLRLSFGIERAVLVNGVLQSSTQLRVSDLGRAVGGGSNPADVLAAPASVAIVQNGLNNSVSATLPAAALATVVQNSLDNQQLQTVTRINATVNSAEMLRGVRMHQSLQDSLNRAALAR